MEINPKQYEEVTDRVAKLVANLKIHDLNGHVIVDTTGRVPTACWSKNMKTGDFTIKLGYELLLKLDADETLGIIEHELLHHVQYRNCDIRNHLMSNIVLDVAINKILYLCNPSVTESWAHKVYHDEETAEKWTYKIEGTDKLGNFLEDPVVLACPHLDADDIQQIPDPQIQAAYIDIWGSRETSADFNMDVPVPLSLYYRLVKFIDENEPQDSQFGEESDEEGEGENESNGNSGNSGQSSDDSDAKDSDSDSDADGKSSNKSKSKKKSKKRCSENDADSNEQEDSNEAQDSDDGKEEESGGGSGSSEDKEDDSDKEDEKDKGKGKGKGKDKEDTEDKEDKEDGDDKSEGGDKDEEDADSEDKADGDSSGAGKEDGEEQESKGNNSGTGYGELETDPLEEFFQEKADEAKQAGKGQSKINFAFAPPPEIDSYEVEARIRERIFEQTVDEIGDIVAGTLQDNSARQPYVTRPTRTTLTHMACGVTDYLPVYFNEVPGQGRPKVGCYVDVSGSMDRHMRLVHSIMCRIGEFMPSMSFVFSDYVMPLPTLAWNDVVPLGGGTSFRSVFQHVCLPCETKQKWIEEWIDKNSVNQCGYGHNSTLKRHIAGYIQEIGVQADFLNEDFPVIFLITDGEDNVPENLIQQFKASGKKLVVLLLTEHVIVNKDFEDMGATIIQINSEAQIISRGTD